MRSLQVLEERIAEGSAFVMALQEELGRIVVGQRTLLERLLVALLADGHVLLEGVPGLAKTLIVNALAQAIQARFQRVQFTPDLLPADLVGTLIYDQRQGRFYVRKGPIFANLLLADEVNRAPAKVQSALLEAMQERQVTIGEETYPLPEPFWVLATQNPIEQEGTYPLPEAQLDRFMFKVHVDYPTAEEELEIMRRMARTGLKPQVRAVVRPEAILAARTLVNEVYLDERLERYIVDLVQATRRPECYGLKGLAPYIRYGASPRGTIYLSLAARARAFLHRRAYVMPDDVRTLALDVLRHRIVLSYEAEAEEITADHILREILERLPVP